MDRYGDMFVFHRTADAGSFSAAARALSLSPSTVSKLVQRLEDRLGARLFNRTSRSLSLTVEGEALYERAAAVIEAMEAAESVVSSASASPKGCLRVHCLPTFASYRIAPLMPEFMRRYPEMRVEFILGNESVDPAAANIDVLIRSGTLADSSLIARRIAGSRWVMCATPRYLQENGTPRRPEDLLEHNCLNFTTNPDWNHWPVREHGHVQRIRVCGNMASNYGEMIRELALASAGIARLAEFHVAADLAAGRLVPLPQDFNDDGEEGIFAVYQRRRNLTPRIRCFIDFLHEQLGDSDWRSEKPSRPTQAPGPAPAKPPAKVPRSRAGHLEQAFI